MKPEIRCKSHQRRCDYGCAVARELSRYQLKTCVVEEEEDVCSGTSKDSIANMHGFWHKGFQNSARS